VVAANECRQAAASFGFETAAGPGNAGDPPQVDRVGEAS